MNKKLLAGELNVNGGLKVPASNGVQLDKFVFVSGQLAYDDNGTYCSGTVKEETRLVINNLQRILALAGCTLADVVKCNCWLSDKKSFKEFNEEYLRHFLNGIKPVRSTVEAGLMFDAKVEIECIAVTPDKEI